MDKTQARSSYQVVMDSVKLVLKQRKITYGDLAKRLKLSESGVKKILSASDGSFGRLTEICTELGLSLPQLLAGHEERVLEIAYSDKQQNFLLENPRAFHLYWAMTYERRTLQEAQKTAGLENKEAFSLLRKLDQLHLLQLLPGDRVRVPPVRLIRWVGEGPLVRKLYQEWSMSFLRAVAKPNQAPGEHFQIRYFRASRKTRDDFIAALKELELEFVRRSTREMRSEAPDLTHLRWICGVDGRSFLDTP